MVELYFLLYRVPRMMTRLARERNRSGLVWSLLAIGAWIGAEIIVVMVLTILYEIGVLLLDWPSRPAPFVHLLIYLVSLGSAIVAVTLVRRVLCSANRNRFAPLPPLPPSFESDVE